MTKDEADAIIELAKRLLEEDCAVETRQRIARKIIVHARAITASCMAEHQAATCSTVAAWGAVAGRNCAKALAKKVPYQTLEGPAIPVMLTKEQAGARIDAAFRRAMNSLNIPANYG